MTRLRVSPRAAELVAGFAAIRAELRLPDAFPPDVLAEARAAAAAAATRPRADRTGVPLVTIDPPGSLDLDQAYGATRRGSADGGGYRLTYAIADVGVYVAPGGALDAETRRRGSTLYAPDRRVPLHPDELGEGTASLLPGAERPAVLWTFDLDADAQPVTTRVERATVRSNARLDYDHVQHAIDGGTADESLTLLREIGTRRQRAEQERGGVSLPVPNQEVVSENGGYALAFVAPLPVEGWNAQVSLLTGMAAAKVMLEGGVGLLRTMPPPDPRDVTRLRHSAHALRVPWPDGMPYAGFIRGLDATVPAHAALLDLATRLLRGAGYTAFDGTPPPLATHSAIAASYAHATAPLRRLADRFVSETVVALHDGREVPPWCTQALPLLPSLMAAANHREHELDRAILDYVEAAVLAKRVGETFEAVVTEVDEHSGMVQVADPAVRARLDGHAPLGERIEVRLTTADPATRQVRFAPA